MQDEKALPRGHSEIILSLSIATVEEDEYRIGPMSDPSYSRNLSSTRSSSCICFPRSNTPRRTHRRHRSQNPSTKYELHKIKPTTRKTNLLRRNRAGTVRSRSQSKPRGRTEEPKEGKTLQERSREALEESLVQGFKQQQSIQRLQQEEAEEAKEQEEAKRERNIRNRRCDHFNQLSAIIHFGNIQ